jgi:hypothetical protein
VRFVAQQTCLVCAAGPAMPTICALRKPARSAARSATNSQFPCADDIIASSIATVMKLWWQTLGLDPTIAARALWLETHPQALI